MSGFDTGEKPFAKHNVMIEFKRKVYQSVCFSYLRKKKTNESNPIKRNLTQKAHTRPTQSARCCCRKGDILRWDRQTFGGLVLLFHRKTAQLSQSAAALPACSCAAAGGSSQTAPARSSAKVTHSTPFNLHSRAGGSTQHEAARRSFSAVRLRER